MPGPYFAPAQRLSPLTGPVRIRRIRTRPLITSLCIAVTALAAAPASALAQRCGRVYVPSREAKAKVRVVNGPDSCAAAKRLIAAAFKAEATRHWNGTDMYGSVIWRVSGRSCGIGLAGSETLCARGRRRVDGSFRTDDAWDFYLLPLQLPSKVRSSSSGAARPRASRTAFARQRQAIVDNSTH